MAVSLAARQHEVFRLCRIFLAARARSAKIEFTGWALCGPRMQCSISSLRPDLPDTPGPYVCTGCCSQMIFWHVLGSRSYVFGLFIDTRVVALLGLRTRRDLISGQVDYDLKGRQILGA